MSEKTFNHQEIENNWRELWIRDNVCGAEDNSTKPKKYILVEFPYPSGLGLHMGHFMRYTLPEIYSRKLRMSGYNVLFPFGWDAFGLPAESYAIKTGVHPAVTTEQAIKNFLHAVQYAGFGIDWPREVNTTDPSYYKWTQWIFLKLYEAGLAEFREEPVWWCEALKSVLANEEVLEGPDGQKVSERGEHPVERRMLKQWVLKIPQYADKLLAGLEEVDYPESIRAAQRNWIGRSEGAIVSFQLPLGNETKKLEVFTTRPDTIFGVTFLCLAPEHPFVEEIKKYVSNPDEVARYVEVTKNRSELERQASTTKTGVKLEGVTVRHPLLNIEVPLYIADYILMGYGTGAIMGVPAHDERDYEFAKLLTINIEPVIYPIEGEYPQEGAFTEKEGVVLLTEKVATLLSEEEKAQYQQSIPASDFGKIVTKALEAQGAGRAHVTYRLRDWVFSRQRYWGEPIPLVHLEDGTVEAIVTTTDEKGVHGKLPLLLPEVPDYTPSSDGSSPLAKNKEWISITLPDGRKATRETNTMPGWAGSCWYYLRFIDPHNTSAFADPEKLKYWLPVDKYFGGAEHTTVHLLYSRFWHRFLYDQGLVPTPEPYLWRINGGILLGSDGHKQSKSRGNVVDLNSMLEAFGADALRAYICFLGPYDGTLTWNDGGLKACRKLVETIYSFRTKVEKGYKDEEFLLRKYHRMVKRVTQMVDNLKMNTAISEFMIFVNEAKKVEKLSWEIWNGFTRLLAPFMVFLAEELWQEAHGYTEWKVDQSVHRQEWPTYDEALAQDEKIVVGVQVNGKLRSEIEVTEEDSLDTVREKVLELPEIQKWLEGKAPKKVIYVPLKIVSIVK